MKTFFVYFVFMAAAMLSMISCVRRTDEAEKEPDNPLVGGLTLDADSLRMELTDTLRVAVGGTGGFTVGVADEAVAEARAEGRTIVVAAVGCGFTSVRVVSEGSRRHEIVLPVRVVERRTPWAFDDALADASVRRWDCCLPSCGFVGRPSGQFQVSCGVCVATLSAGWCRTECRRRAA